MSDLNPDFVEVEHKFLVSRSFDKTTFFEKIKKLGPREHYEASVKDSYFIFRNHPQFIYRHRYDEKLQCLTVKSNRYFTKKDNEVREEINILLSQNLHSQYEQVFSFLKTFGPLWFDCILKKVCVFDFADCEICHYEATTNNNNQTYYCVEFEAKKFASIDEAKLTLIKYENELGFSSQNRETKSIFELLFKNDLANIFGSTDK